MHRHRWPPLLATGLLISASAILLAAYTAYATDVDITQTGRCVNADTRRFDVTVTAHNRYGQPLHIVIMNPESPLAKTLEPGQVWSFTFHVTDEPFNVKVTSTDAVLHGDLSHTWTAEEVCGVPATTTTSPPPTSCQQAVPPRRDCQPSDTTVTPPPSTVPPSAAPTPPSGPVTSAPAPTTPGAGDARATTTIPHNLPVTGSEWASVAGVAIGAASVGLGMALVIFATRRRSRP